jgi:tetratricopeptide (TPR) repeat protein
LFYRLLQDETRPQSVRDAAWFYLGKLHYIRGNWLDAEQSFARVSESFSPRLTAEMDALRVNLQIRREQLVPIPLKQLNEKALREWSGYALYNMGAAYARRSDYPQARAYYREMIDTDIPDGKRAYSEYLALRDKSYTALGYSFLLEKSYSAAIEEFVQVRLNSPQSHQALLGYGWAAMQQEQYAEALRPWQVLRKRSLIYPEAQEAQLALPFAYEKLGANGEALSAYETAEQLLSAEIERITEMRTTLTQGELLTLIGSPAQSTAQANEVLRAPTDDPTTLTAIVADDGANWLALDKTSILKTRSAYLSELFAQNAFQTAVLDLRDLLRLRKLLQEWQPKLEIYTELLVEKQSLRVQSEQLMAQQALRNQQAKLAGEQERLNREFTQIRNNENYMALADDNSRDLYRLVERSQTTLDRLRLSGQDTTEEQTRLDLYRGILLWQAAQEFPSRLWQSEKNRQLSAHTLVELDETYTRINQLSATHTDIAPLLSRITLLQADTAAHLATTEAEINMRSEALRARVDAKLAHQQQRLKAYLAQAHLAVARLYDSALRKQTP